MLSTALKAARVKAGLSQAELAAEAGVDQSFVSRIESGERTNVGIKHLCDFEDALELKRGTLAKASFAKAS